MMSRRDIKSFLCLLYFNLKFQNYILSKGIIIIYLGTHSNENLKNMDYKYVIQKYVIQLHNECLYTMLQGNGHLGIKSFFCCLQNQLILGVMGVDVSLEDIKRLTPRFTVSCIFSFWETGKLASQSDALRLYLANYIFDNSFF